MYADAVAKITESIFPVFLALPQGDQYTMGVSGTGFFVDDHGLFVTNHHIMDAIEGSRVYYYGKVPDAVCDPAVEIEFVAHDPRRDLYLGRIARDYLRPVQLSCEPVRPGDSVCLCGYPMAVISGGATGSLVGNVRRYWEPTFVVDAAQAVIERRTYDGYIVKDPCLPGMSGGPVFDINGQVRGMAAANLTRSIPQPGANPIVVSNGIVIDIDQILRFIQPYVRG